MLLIVFAFIYALQLPENSERIFKLAVDTHFVAEDFECDLIFRKNEFTNIIIAVAFVILE
ncbi:MAG: hypothetical protein ABIE07_08855 [Candidatus Zixiibacteriota bacterium]